MTALPSNDALTQEAAITGVLSFYDLSGTALGLRDSAFTAREHVRRLATIVKCSSDDKAVIAASRELRALIKEKLEVNSLIAQMSETREAPDGTKQTYQLQSLISKQENPHAPQQEGHHIRPPLPRAAEVGNPPSLPDGALDAALRGGTAPAEASQATGVPQPGPAFPP